MRILHVIPGLGAGGGAEQSFVLGAEALLAAGHQLHVVLLTERRTLVPELERAGAVVHDLSGRTRWQRPAAVARVVRAVAPDVVHATLFMADAAVQVAAPFLGVPVVVTWPATPWSAERRGEPGLVWWKVQVVRAYAALLARWSRCTFQAVTPGVARENARALRVDPTRVVVAERGRPEPPAADAARVARTRSALGLADGDRVVLCVARHEPPKGVHRLVAALDGVVARVPDVRVVVAGREGSATSALRSAQAAAVHGDRLHLLGHRDDVAALLEAADVVVSVSLNEGAAGAVIEAMAARRPIVASPVAGLEGILEDGVNARVVDASDAEALASALAEVLGDAALAERLAAGGRRTFEERFTTARSAAALVALYEGLVRERTRRSA